MRTPKSAPEKVDISPNATNIEWSITPGGGIVIAAINSPQPTAMTPTAVQSVVRHTSFRSLASRSSFSAVIVLSSFRL